MGCYDPLKAVRQKGGFRFLPSHSDVGAERQRGHEVLSLPCGKCIGCRLDHSKMWMIRILHEASQHDTNSFITLTYNDEHLPHGIRPSLDLRDLQLFHKRARKGRSYRYFCSGEYGGEHGRPHYHILAFGWNPTRDYQATKSTWHSEEVADLWSANGSPLGDVTVGDITTASAAYVAQYVLKKQRNKAEREADRKPEFITMSTGIGRDWLEKYGKELDRGYVVIEGRKIRLPRYYINKKGEQDPEWLLLRKLEAKRERREKEFDVNEPRNLENKRLNLEARRKLYGSGGNTSPEDRQ